MTTKDKEVFRERLKNLPIWEVEAYDEEPGQYRTVSTYAISDINSIVNDMAEEYSLWRSGEDEYLKAMELVSNMETEARQWQDIATHHEEELKKLRLIVSTLEFAYGRKLDI